jgi:hypothetical protein
MEGNFCAVALGTKTESSPIGCLYFLLGCNILINLDSNFPGNDYILVASLGPANLAVYKLCIH